MSPLQAQIKGAQALPSTSALSAAGRLLGVKGGIVTAAAMTPAQRHARAKKASAARWEKVRKTEKEKHNGSTR